MNYWLNIISYTLNITFGILLLYPFGYIALTGRYLHEARGFILYGEIGMSVAIVVFGVAMVIRDIRRKA